MLKAALSALGFACLISGIATAENGDRARCDRNILTVPSVAGAMSFEAAGQCRGFADAWNRRVMGDEIRTQDGERLEIMDWMAANLSTGESLMLDRFGRAHLMRCAKGDGHDGPPMRFNTPVGIDPDNQRVMFAIMTLEPGTRSGAANCPAG
jgi:hypothetical protein